MRKFLSSILSAALLLAVWPGTQAFAQQVSRPIVPVPGAAVAAGSRVGPWVAPGPGVDVAPGPGVAVALGRGVAVGPGLGVGLGVGVGVGSAGRLTVNTRLLCGNTPMVQVAAS